MVSVWVLNSANGTALIALTAGTELSYLMSFTIGMIMPMLEKQFLVGAVARVMLLTRTTVNSLISPGAGP